MQLIKEIREGSGISQTELAEATNMSRKKLYNIENGLSTPKEEDLDLISKAIADRIDLAYVAGLFDRASTITITKTKPRSYTVSDHYVARIVFGSKHKILCDIINEVFGVGAVCGLKQPNDSTRWSYYAASESVDIVCEKLLPYIKLKRNKVLVLMEFRKFLEESRDDYRNSGIWQQVKQNTKAPKDSWLTSRQFTAKFKGLIGVQATISHIERGNLVAEKFLHPTKKYYYWRIAPITNFNEMYELVKEGKKPLSQEVIDQYEYFWKRIREV